MKKMIVSMMLIISMFAFAAESAPSNTVGYVRYSNIEGNNFVALPMQAGFGMASDFEAHNTSAVYRYNAATQAWVGADMLFAGFWNNDFAVTSGQPYWIFCGAVNDLVISGELVENPSYNLVAGNNGLMVPLTHSHMTMASSYEAETGSAVTNVYRYNAATQAWVGADMLFPGFWNNDFAIGIADPHWVFSTSAFEWPSKKDLPVVDNQNITPNNQTKGDPKTVIVGILDAESQEYVEAGLAGVTFQAWLQQGTGEPITEPSLNLDGYPTEPYNQITQEFTDQSDVSMISYRGAIQFNMQFFNTWGLNNILRIRIKDEAAGTKSSTENETSWVIDDVTLNAKGIGMEPLMGGTGAPLPLNNPSSVESNLPTVTRLHQNYPNPFNPTTTIKFDLASDSNVRLNVYNYNGQLVRSLVNGPMNAGYHTVNFDAASLSAGVYYYTMEAAGRTMTQKMVLVK